MKITYEYEIMAFYSGRWEIVTTEETFKEAKEQLKCYNLNESNPHKIRRVKC